ncbi:protein translocase subunit SecD [Kineococcus rubinsiae]|uniref:protein translocase subunit SecD n=1 Tax=Kineococcus rubinsiae TaxID=2609562 RepID=UPI00143215A9|nr:protein translocase subunit SecD [Kineococcus rubinsiae]NIZ89815.1 protein translocase subunit SecD [Kineococcus rubinsiae]
MLAVIVVLLFGAVGAGSVWGAAKWSPGLALDLEGGTQVVLQARATQGDAPVDATQMEQAAAIIRQRVDATGLSESEVQVQGGRNISVSIPGQATREQLDLIAQSALLRMRVVLFEAAGAPTPSSAATDPAATDPAATDPAATDPATPAPTTPAPDATASAPATPDASPSTSATGAAAPQALRQATTPSATPSAAPTSASTTAPAGADATPTTGTGPGQPTDTPSPAPTDASDQVQLQSADVQRLFTQLDCSNPANRTGGIVDDPAKVLVTCSQDGSAKYVLGPAEIEGTQLTNASSGQQTNQQGRITGGWQVNLEFDSSGATAFQNLTQRISALTQPANQFAAVLDGLVVTAPSVSSVIPGGKAQITGNFTEASADALAQQLKFGALPLSFEVQTEDQVSATLGSEQLRNGLIAGLIGLVLVVGYSLLQYRGLGLVTVGSLVLAAALNWGVILLLSWLQGFRLSLAGVAGLIVAIGVTADSFILFFERVRDEIRDGRILSSAVEAGWRRARRTIIISDAVSLLSAVVLYVLATGNVRGFAYTLGITTVIDVVIVFLFTHPVVALLGRTKFFGGGHKWSGFDPEHLGSVVARGALHSGAPRPTLASLRAQERERARAGGGTTVVEDHDGPARHDEHDGGNA